jgi:hypothetical protein
MGKLFKSLLFWNQSANLKQTWHGWSLGSILSKLCPVTTTSIQDGCRGEDFKTFFPIGSYVKTTVCLLKVAILDGGQGHWTQFWPSNEHFYQVWFKSVCQKPPSQLNCDFAGMIIGWSCTKIVNRLPIGNSRWPPWLWISDQRQKQKSCIWPSNEHFCQVWFKSVLWFQKKRWKCEIPIGSNVKLSRVMAAFFSETTKRFEPNLAVMFIGWSYEIFVFFVLDVLPTWLPGPIMCSDWSKFKNFRLANDSQV